MARYLDSYSGLGASRVYGSSPAYHNAGSLLSRSSSISDGSMGLSGYSVARRPYLSDAAYAPSYSRGSVIRSASPPAIRTVSPSVVPSTRYAQDDSSIDYFSGGRMNVVQAPLMDKDLMANWLDASARQQQSASETAAGEGNGNGVPRKVLRVGESEPVDKPAAPAETQGAVEPPKMTTIPPIPAPPGSMLRYSSGASAYSTYASQSPSYAESIRSLPRATAAQPYYGRQLVGEGSRSIYRSRISPYSVRSY